ncbi:MAG: phosphatase PAP2 family protein [Crocinitomicaceae bacterium]
METLEAWDRAIVLAVNGWHQPWLDEIMWFVSGKLTWFPIWLLFVYYAYKSLSRNHFWLFLFCALASIGIADVTAKILFKDVIMRYRPSHNLLLMDQLHFYEEYPGTFYRGGNYGFISNHASNFFAILSWVVVLFWKAKKWFVYVMLFAAILVAFSRLYLGVHYLSDLIGGATWGIFISYLVYRFIYLPRLKKQAL